MHKNLHLGKPCKINAPLEVCLSFDNIAHSLAHHGGYARLISKEEAKDILTTAYESNLVQMVENVREHPAFMCNCCGCCCEALGAAKKFGPMQPIATSSYMPSVSEGCVGCGICARNCHKKSIILNRRPVEIITPVNSTHRYVVQAIEKGTLQNLIFDNQAFASHRAMAAVLGVILKLPPLKQAMASKQFKSIYLDRLLSNQKKREQ